MESTLPVAPVATGDDSDDADTSGIGYGSVGLDLPETITYNEWEAIGRSLQHMEHGIQWWVGDWLVHGEFAYGDKWTQAVALLPSFKLKTMMNYQFVARAIPQSRRREDLTFSHHAEVAKLEPEAQAAWLERAAAEEWTVRELRKALEDEYGEPAADDDGEDVSFRTNPNDDAEQFRRQRNMIAQLAAHFAAVAKMQTGWRERNDDGGLTLFIDLPNGQVRFDMDDEEMLADIGDYHGPDQNATDDEVADRIRAYLSEEAE